MIETKITLTIKHTRPLPDLCDLVAGRAYTLSHVEDVTAEVVPQAEGVPDVVRDAERYRWLRDKSNDVALVIDKRTEWVPPDESVAGVGGYWMYEYRAGEELDSEIDAALAATPNPHQPPKPSPNEWVLE